MLLYNNSVSKKNLFWSFFLSNMVSLYIHNLTMNAMLLVERHLVDRTFRRSNFVESFFVEKHFVDRAFRRRSILSNNFCRKAFRRHDTLSTRHFVDTTYRRQGILSKSTLSTRFFVERKLYWYVGVLQLGMYRARISQSHSFALWMSIL